MIRFVAWGLLFGAWPAFATEGALKAVAFLMFGALGVGVVVGLLLLGVLKGLVLDTARLAPKWGRILICALFVVTFGVLFAYRLLQDFGDSDRFDLYMLYAPATGFAGLYVLLGHILVVAFPLWIARCALMMRWKSAALSLAIGVGLWFAGSQTLLPIAKAWSAITWRLSFGQESGVSELALGSATPFDVVVLTESETQSIQSYLSGSRGPFAAVAKPVYRMRTRQQIPLEPGAYFGCFILDFPFGGNLMCTPFSIEAGRTTRADFKVPRRTVPQELLDTPDTLILRTKRYVDVVACKNFQSNENSDNYECERPRHVELLDQVGVFSLPMSFETGDKRPLPVFRFDPDLFEKISKAIGGLKGATKPCPVGSFCTVVTLNEVLESRTKQDAFFCDEARCGAKLKELLNLFDVYR